jgi:DNA-binding transcriptional LysR family regulator
MDRVDAMRVFVAVAEHRGFSAAGRRLRLSPPAITRAIAALERRLGARLLHRTTRIVRLTEAGGRFLADCHRILAELEEAEASAAGSHREPRGLISITAPAMFGRVHVAPIVLAFLARYPRIQARTLLLDRVVDLYEEGLDVAVRIAHLPDSGLAAVRVGSIRRVVCAAPDYLARHGTPRTPADLAKHDLIAFSADQPPTPWSFSTARIQPTARLTVNSAEVAVAAAVAGRGLTRVLSYQIAPELRARKLRIVLADLEQPALPIHLVHREGRNASARVRAFVDFAAARLRADKALARLAQLSPSS